MIRRLLPWLRRSRAPQLIRPPIERYIRCTVTVGDWTIEPGIEWRHGDHFADMSRRIARIAGMIGSFVNGGSNPIDASRYMEDLLSSADDPWHGRAFFVEIHDIHGAWTQTFQPFGVPRQA